MASTTTTTTITTTTTTPTTPTASLSPKRKHRDENRTSDFSEGKRKCWDPIEVIDTLKADTSEDKFELEHQEVLLLHGVKQRYQHTTKHQIPKAEDDGEMLVKVTVVGLNPIDWKAP